MKKSTFTNKNRILDYKSDKTISNPEIRSEYKKLNDKNTFFIQTFKIG